VPKLTERTTLQFEGMSQPACGHEMNAVNEKTIPLDGPADTCSKDGGGDRAKS
jgi:hypothetical protein